MEMGTPGQTCFLDQTNHNLRVKLQRKAGASTSGQKHAHIGAHTQPKKKTYILHNCQLPQEQNYHFVHVINIKILDPRWKGNLHKAWNPFNYFT